MLSLQELVKLRLQNTPGKDKKKAVFRIENSLLFNVFYKLTERASSTEFFLKERSQYSHVL